MKKSPELDSQLPAAAKTVAVQLRLPIFKGRGGLVPGFDARSNKAMLDAMDGAART